MTLTASDANELLCDNNTVKTHHDNRSDFLRKLGFLDKIFSKKQFFLFATKFIRISRKSLSKASIVIADIYLVLFALRSLWTLLQIKSIFFKWRSWLESQVFFSFFSSHFWNSWYHPSPLRGPRGCRYMQHTWNLANFFRTNFDVIFGKEK